MESESESLCDSISIKVSCAQDRTLLRSDLAIFVVALWSNPEICICSFVRYQFFVVDPRQTLILDVESV